MAGQRPRPPSMVIAPRHRATAGQPAHRRDRPSGQDPSPGRTQRTLHQGPVPARPCPGHGHLPRQAHRPDRRQRRSTPAPPRPSQLRPGVRGLPASRPMHQRAGWPHRHHHRLRARAGHCPRPPGRPGPRRRLPLNPAQGGAQACPSGPPPPRRPSCAGPRPCQGRRRLQPAGRRGQPGPAGRARSALDPSGRLGSSVTRSACPPGDRGARLPAPPVPSGSRDHALPPAGGRLERSQSQPHQPVSHQPPSRTLSGLLLTGGV